MLLPIAIFALAVAPESWVPARWQGGPETLDLLAGTSINCLLVPWSATLNAFAQAAKSKGIAVIGVVSPGLDPEKVVSAGLDAIALDAIALEDAPKFLAESKLPVIPLGERKLLGRDARWPVLATSEGAWPRLRLLTEQTDAGPSSDPWIYSNTWLVRSMRAWSGSRPVWLAYPPEDDARPEDYARAIADAAVAGGRWVVTLDRRKPEAPAAWRKIVEFLKFYEEHAEWRRWAAAGSLVIVQDAAAPDPDMSDENLNLIARRQVPYRVIERRDLSAAALAGFRAVVATDIAAPTEAERKILLSFQQGGGEVIAGAAPDPEILSKHMRNLLGDGSPVRLFNASAVLGYVASDGGRLLVQLVNYATAPARDVTVRTKGEYRKARFFMPGAAARDLEIDSSEIDRSEIVIPTFAVSAAVLFEK